VSGDVYIKHCAVLDKTVLDDLDVAVLDEAQACRLGA
jgi:hypothetical protein